MTGNGDTELAALSAELVALTVRDHSSLAAEIRAAADRMRHVAQPKRRWIATLLGTASDTTDEAMIKVADRDLDQIATRISHLGEAARGRAIVLRRLAEKAARVATNTYITGMNATFIEAAATKAAVAEDMAADAADRFLTQALPLWRSTRAHGNSQMRRAAGAVEAALDALGTTMAQSRSLTTSVTKLGSS